MKFVADFHIHSKYSRATSKDMDLDHITEWAKLKGISIMGTGDFTHPLWLDELERKLEPVDNGLYKYKDVHFILTAEISNMYTKNQKGRRIHSIVIAPDIKTVKKINRELEYSANLHSDGRPIMGIEAKELLKIVMGVNPDCLFVPGHIWTPWYSIFGSNSGFDSIEECFEEQTKNVYALETGLSSDPAMNWRWSALDKYTLVSNSDSHSPSRIGREANVFDCELDYKEIMEVLKKKDPKRFLYTVEFFPEEGKYHWDGHRRCDLRLSPKQSRENNNRCPKCGAKLTIGVMNRVEQLCDREEGFKPDGAIPFKNMISLDEIIAEAKGLGKQSQSVEREYREITHRLGTEFEILFERTEEELLKYCPPKLAKGIMNVRNSKVKVLPGYDGVYGTIDIFDRDKSGEEKQMTLF